MRVRACCVCVRFHSPSATPPSFLHANFSSRSSYSNDMITIVRATGLFVRGALQVSASYHCICDERVVRVHWLCTGVGLCVLQTNTRTTTT